MPISNFSRDNKLVRKIALAATSALVTVGMLSTGVLSAQADTLITDANLPAQTKTAVANLKIAQGAGTLVDTTDQPSPAMTDANGAAAVDSAVPAGMAATTDTDWFTSNYMPLNWFENQEVHETTGNAFIGQTIAQDYYVRVSVNRDKSNKNMLVELMRKNNNTPLESLTLTPTAKTGQFTTFSTMWPQQVTVGSRSAVNNTPISVEYNTDGANASATALSIFVGETKVLQVLMR
ncbi:hypothetical protein EJ419_05310 [Alloscardovia theropitheci]|uniref:Uncharacterized protein n=1 Tax=Alloscardovia theropitheci TaxID=2496842 RepID=A0A4R0QVA2_9BIFI|nr:hypothetical protein [Alloscardovia theropitheci]TCD54077.1 hypothetical protein EJ419_05310 [Alloscardovia theropitheci]